jgi:hypothetical protein
MADRTFTLDWRVRTRKQETLVRAKLGTLDTQMSFRKRVRGPVRIDPSMLVPSEAWEPLAELPPPEEGLDAPPQEECLPDEPILRRAAG